MTSCCGLAATVRIGFVLIGSRNYRLLTSCQTHRIGLRPIGSRNSIGIALRLKESVKAGDESVDASMV